MRLALAVLAITACQRRGSQDALAAISEDVRAGRFAAAAARIAAAELPARPALAFRAASDAPASALDALAAAAVEPELATTAADRLEQERGPTAALAARERAAATGPDRAEHHDALARARLAAGQTDDALTAWDRAAALAPVQPQYRLAPIRALATLGDRDRACARAEALATGAGDVERLGVASTAAAACGDHPRAVALARAARDLRPGDGRLVFNLAERLAEAGDPAAVDALVELLVCGARGRAWHRHEIAARLLALADIPEAARHALDALDAPRACTPADASDLARYLQSIRSRLK